MTRRMVPVLLVMAMLATSCNYLFAQRTINASGGTDVPWWCEGPPDLSPADCLEFSFQLDIARIHAYRYFDLDDFIAAGATEVAAVDVPGDIGVAFALPGCCAAFDPMKPNMLLYDGNTSGARLVGMLWAVDGVSAPSGFVGTRDVWSEISGRWFLSVWKVRGYENHPNVFAASHPCLTGGASLTATTDACYVASHTEDLEILVTNDDGIGAPGIDQLVEDLILVAGVDVTVVAPAANQSGSGENTTPGPLTANPGTTASGYPGTAVDGFPADSVIYAMDVLGLNPGLVISGINAGQNMGPIASAPLSGTVGAAMRAVRYNVPAAATSQGFGSPDPDFPSGSAATLAWLEEFRLGTAGPEFKWITNINTPTCVAGAIRGTLDVVVDADTQMYNIQDCTSTTPPGSIVTDIDAFNHGFIGIAEVKPS